MYHRACTFFMSNGRSSNKTRKNKNSKGPNTWFRKNPHHTLIQYSWGLTFFSEIILCPSFLYLQRTFSKFRQKFFILHSEKCLDGNIINMSCIHATAFWVNTLLLQYQKYKRLSVVSIVLHPVSINFPLYDKTRYFSDQFTLACSYTAPFTCNSSLDGLRV